MDEKMINKEQQDGQGKPKIVSRIFRKLDEFIKASHEEVRQGREKMRRDGHLK